jgi:S-formylglutathione hydrolase FrmB
MRPLTRRQVFAAGAAGIAGAGLLGAAAAGNLHDDARRFRDWIERRPDPFVPNAPEGRWSVESVHSAARGRDVDLFTAVPHGYGTGAGLPVCLILHGATARPHDFEPFGLPRFLTAAVARGAPPFVLMGADGGLLYWEPDPDDGGDDPQRMVLEELPRWAEERGFDAGRLAAWGWSMGGFGVLHIAETQPGFLRGAAAFSPAVAPGDDVFDAIGKLAGTPLGIWCGRDDPLYPDVRELVAALPEAPRVLAYAPGAHTRIYWNSVTLPALGFVGSVLGSA